MSEREDGGPPGGVTRTHGNSEVVERLVQVAANGPLIVPWALSVRFPDGRVEKRPPAGTAFCRCGHSGTKPYCDGSHNKAGFVG